MYELEDILYYYTDKNKCSLTELEIVGIIYIDEIQYIITQDVYVSDEELHVFEYDEDSDELIHINNEEKSEQIIEQWKFESEDKCDNY